jgi:hypothetical protein
MPVTATKKRSVREAINSGNPADTALGLQKMQFGSMSCVVKATVVALASAAAIDITAAATKAAATIVGLTLATGENLPAAGTVQSVRVTAGAAAAGLRQIGDAGATASATVAKLSDDGKTLTFEAGVTAFVLVYTPRAAVAPDATDIQPLS